MPLRVGVPSQRAVLVQPRLHTSTFYASWRVPVAPSTAPHAQPARSLLQTARLSCPAVHVSCLSTHGRHLSSPSQQVHLSFTALALPAPLFSAADGTPDEPAAACGGRVPSGKEASAGAGHLQEQEAAGQAGGGSLRGNLVGASRGN